ncbi:GNAT family N-acetyltransferase [Actinoplanes sp. M2I2]|uniref:GNAT family N-acetyltransferase n=1 Tax=Actinoplanes sp. M2I2 TaxID=1734444 RepID=UPI002022671E|nr:GNAT family N-acetyltransferase [Actinoplanes sp. M2I2]
MNDDYDSVSVVPANEASWDDLQTVFGRGGAATCQCQRIKLGDRDWFAMAVEERAHRLREETDCGHPEAEGTSGLVAYRDGEPVGWVAVEPRAGYRRLRGSSVPWAGRDEDPDDPDVWAVVCFAIRPGHRRQGLTRPLARAAAEYARAHGAKAVEGYPMVPRDGQNVSWGEMNVGSRGTFLAAGFREVAHPTTRRVVMRLDLTDD